MDDFDRIHGIIYTANGKPVVDQEDGRSRFLAGEKGLKMSWPAPRFAPRWMFPCTPYERMQAAVETEKLLRERQARMDEAARDEEEKARIFLRALCLFVIGSLLTFAMCAAIVAVLYP